MPLRVRTYRPFRTAAPDGAILTDIVVVSDTCPSALEVPLVDVLNRCMACLRMVQDNFDVLLRYDQLPLCFKFASWICITTTLSVVALLTQSLECSLEERRERYAH